MHCSCRQSLRANLRDSLDSGSDRGRGHFDNLAGRRRSTLLRCRSTGSDGGGTVIVPLDDVRQDDTAKLLDGVYDDGSHWADQLILSDGMLSSCCRNPLLVACVVCTNNS